MHCVTQGGTLVLERRMSQGSLISFMLYQGSLSSAFDSLGYCFTGMSAAVGARPAGPPPAPATALRWCIARAAGQGAGLHSIF